MLESRSINTLKNILYGYVGTALTLMLSFVSRTIFINVLGNTYLGVNGLFSNILSILSFTELGLGTALNYSLYKPVAEKDYAKVASLMHLYKISYRIIAAVITVLGISLIPFMDIILNGTEGIENITIYYLIFLFNTVSTYFVSYKYGLLNAEQKNYVLTNINTLFKIIVTASQITVLILYHNFLFYLLVQSVLQLTQQIFTAVYLNKRYEHIKQYEISPVDIETKNTIKTNVRALIYHNVGSVCIYQTDNIIISSFINVTFVGLVSNYNIIIDAANRIITMLMSSFVSSIGNFIAVEKTEKQKSLFEIYDFIGFWVFGMETILLAVLIQPFITLWIGADNKIDDATICFIVLNLFFAGQRASVHYFKMAGGVFEQDKYASIVQSIVNLIISVIGVIYIGLPGVFLGTLLSGFVVCVWKPIVLYNYLFHESSKQYFIRLCRRFLQVGLIISVLLVIRLNIEGEITISYFVMLSILTFVLSNVVLYLIYRNTYELTYMQEKVKNLIERRFISGQ